ncbi:hypothetical protein BC827DRAFT_1187344 [Russula dissimulans]|nr:hypothetical protein BC827DRAFT_1187344 [Russula dissimulans]
MHRPSISLIPLVRDSDNLSQPSGHDTHHSSKRYLVPRRGILSYLPMPTQLSDVFHSRRPLCPVLYCANVPGYIHRTLHVLRASTRVCCRCRFQCRCLRDTGITRLAPNSLIFVPILLDFYRIGEIYHVFLLLCHNNRSLLEIRLIKNFQCLVSEQNSYSYRTLLTWT